MLALAFAGSPQNGLDRKVSRIDIDDDGALEGTEFSRSRTKKPRRQERRS
jgi:hypothetical protein